MGWIADHYGSKAGMLKHLGYRVAWRVHPYTRQRVDVSNIDRLVFVCKGNICRSAFAEIVARSAGFEACSYGLHTTPGKRANEGMTRASAKLGYDLESHRTRCISDYDPSKRDLVLLFESDHWRQLINADAPMLNLAMLGQWARPRRPHIQDPFGASADYCSRVAEVISQAVGNLVADIRTHHG